MMVHITCPVGHDVGMFDLELGDTVPKAAMQCATCGCPTVRRRPTPLVPPPLPRKGWRRLIPWPTIEELAYQVCLTGLQVHTPEGWKP
jgi:hypothetical protein